MEKIIRGLHAFQTTYFASNREFFQGLAKGQLPRALFITCSDSRIVPNLITQTEPGELFILRNAGNIIPPYGVWNGAEAATVEYGIAALGIKQIIVCGHTHCGAMGGLLNPEKVQSMPAVANWLKFAEATRQIVEKNYSDATEEERLIAAIKENVLVQIQNLLTHPAVATALFQEKLKIYAWVYEIESGNVYSYDMAENRFVLASIDHKPVPMDFHSKHILT
ncbi:MAG: carbonic anhydrase [Acidobacteriota bacterium]|nr:carbonic anhydrase [Blastocatellia bacterium]MDW8411131.1 carbonic anhydrase [Acidobacteriota bacterium]